MDCRQKKCREGIFFVNASVVWFGGWYKREKEEED